MQCYAHGHWRRKSSGTKGSLQAFSDCDASPFGVLKCLDKEPLSLDGHFVFDSEFADSLVAGRLVYPFAQKYAERTRRRGKRGAGNLFCVTYAVKAAGSAHFSFPSRGRQELAVISEPGGFITLRIHDIKHDMWYNDTEDVSAGRPSRYLVFDLPTDEVSTLELEVINTGADDTSFVIISN